MSSLAVSTDIQPFPKWLFATLFALVFVGYPIAGLLSAIFGLESTDTSYPYRIIVIGLCLTLIAASLAARRLQVDSWIIIFFLLYGVRLFHDAFIADLFEGDFAFVVFIATVVLPAIALASATRWFDERAVCWMIVSLGFPICALLALVAVFGGAMGDTSFEESGRISFEALNYITIGYTGLFTAIAVLVLWPRLQWMTRVVLLVPTLVLAAYIMVNAAARGPFVAALLGMAAMSLIRGKTLFFWLCIAGAVAIFISLGYTDLPLLERIQGVGSDMSSIERIERMGSSWDFALENPVFGYAYIETIYYSFPHNLLIEAALALGMLGGLLMLTLQVRMVRGIFASFRAGDRLLPLFGVSAFANAWISSAIWAAHDFWVLCGLLFGLASLRRDTAAAMRLGRIADTAKPMLATAREANEPSLRISRT